MTCRALDCVEPPDFPDSSAPLPSLFLSRAVYYNITCPSGEVAVYAGPNAPWIQLVGNQFVGHAGAFSGVTQAAANAAAQAALNAFVANAILLGQVTCQNPLNPVTVEIMERPCGDGHTDGSQTIGSVEDFNNLISGLVSAGVYDLTYAMWNGHKLARISDRLHGCQTWCDQAKAGVKPIDEYWDMTFHNTSTYGNISTDYPSTDNVTVINPDFNGKPTIFLGPNINGGIDFYQLDSSTQLIPQPYEVFVVWKPTPVSGVIVNPAASDRFRVIYDSDSRSTIEWDENVGPGFYQYAGSVGTRINPGVASNYPSVMHGIFNGATSSLDHYTTIHTTLSGANSPGAAGFGQNSFRFGMIYDFSNLSWCGDMAFIAFTKTLTAPQRVAMIAHLKSYYGIGTPTPPPPSVPPDLQLQLDANAIVAANNSTVGIWDDSSGNFNIFWAVVGTPLLRYASQNGLQGVEFIAGAGLTGSYRRDAGQAFTIFLVAKSNSASVTFRRAVQGTNNWLIGPYNNNWQFYDGAFINSGGADALAHIFEVTQTTGTATFKVDGVAIGSNAGATFPGAFCLGRNGGSVESFLGLIYEVQVYSRVLTAGELTTVRSALKTKWGTP